MSSQDAIRDRKTKNKWESLAKRGIFPPKTREEAKRRMKDAHGR